MINSMPPLGYRREFIGRKIKPFLMVTLQIKAVGTRDVLQDTALVL